MGSLAKLFGRVASLSLESESANILKTGNANKIPGSLSLALDGTLRDGHNMTAFGLGTLASMATRERYARFTESMYHVYATMEQELDQINNTPATMLVWKKHGDVLRRSEALYDDLKDVMTSSEQLARLDLIRDHRRENNNNNNTRNDENSTMKLIRSLPTRNYVTAIQQAGARDRHNDQDGDGRGGGASLLGHLYCRYFADLFGGQMLGLPYNLALTLEKNTPRHYHFDFGTAVVCGSSDDTAAATTTTTTVVRDRRQYIETLYKDINTAGALLSPGQRDQILRETLNGFQHNVNVYTEEPIWNDSLFGAMNIGTGFCTKLLFNRSS